MCQCFDYFFVLFFGKTRYRWCSWHDLRHYSKWYFHLPLMVGVALQKLVDYLVHPELLQPEVAKSPHPRHSRPPDWQNIVYLIITKENNIQQILLFLFLHQGPQFQYLFIHVQKSPLFSLLLLFIYYSILKFKKTISFIESI